MTGGAAGRSTSFVFYILHLRTASHLIQQDTQLIPEVLRAAFKRSPFRRAERGGLVIRLFVGLRGHAQIGALKLKVRLAQLAQQHEEAPLGLL